MWRQLIKRVSGTTSTSVKGYIHAVCVIVLHWEQLNMPEVTVRDAGGATMRLLEIDGTYYPLMASEEQMRAVRNIKARDDDVLIVSFNTSGTHWLWEILSMLHKRSAESIQRMKEMNMLEAMSEEQLNAIPSPRVLNTHFRFDRLPSDMIAKKTKLVLIHRNPKDVAVSMYNHHVNITGLYDYHGKWDDYLPSLFLPGNTDCGPWFKYVLHWEQVIQDNPDFPIHLMFYEELKEDSVREIKKLVKFLGLEVSDDLCADIADKCRFENMVKDKEGLENCDWETMWRDNKPNTYRKGQVGDWKNWFTVAQSEMFDEWYRDKMANSKLKFRYDLK